jgi:hypothetical protein
LQGDLKRVVIFWRRDNRLSESRGDHDDAQHARRRELKLESAVVPGSDLGDDGTRSFYPYAGVRYRRSRWVQDGSGERGSSVRR